MSEVSDIEYYEKRALAALYRAAFEVAERAKKENRKLPIWRDGKIVYGFPNITAEQVAAVDAVKPLRRTE